MRLLTYDDFLIFSLEPVASLRVQRKNP